MNLVNIDGYYVWKKDKESAFKAENEIIQDMLSKGIDGLEWLVLQVQVDEDREKSLNKFMDYCYTVEKKQFDGIVKDAVTMDHETFYEKHELNWWIAVDESLTYLALQKQNDYDQYFNLLQSSYK